MSLSTLRLDTISQNFTDWLLYFQLLSWSAQPHLILCPIHQPTSCYLVIQPFRAVRVLTSFFGIPLPTSFFSDLQFFRGCFGALCHQLLFQQSASISDIRHVNVGWDSWIRTSENARVKVWCLTAWRYPIISILNNCYTMN